MKKLSNFRKLVDQRRNRDTLYASSEYWDAKATELDGYAVSMWPNNHLNSLYHKEQTQLIREFISDFNELRLLDLGCGTGRISRWFASQGANVTGLDFSTKALEIANKQTEGKNPSYICESMFEIDMPNAFDLIICWCSIAVACQNKEQLSNVMARLYQGLVPGGKLFLLEPIHRGPLHRVLNMGLAEFKSVLSNTGFEIERHSALHFWPARLALAYVNWPNFITTPSYHLGQVLMKVPGLRSMGDYHAILASKPA